MTRSDDDLAAAVRAGDRRALARAITLIESTRAADRNRAESLLAALLPKAGGAVRVGVSGAPGVGKSTFIETFGLQLIGEGHRVAVLAVDPSSRRGGGALLADKTRMSRLARSPAAFIRPSPAGETLGGVARRTREAMLACEAAGFDIAVVETVGVGQSETAVADMVDVFLLLLAPGAGDELQGLKRGIVELADLIVVNKADGDLAAAARRVQAEYHAALGLLRPANPAWTPRVLVCSARDGEGVAEVWQAIEAYRETLGPSDGIAARRARQARAWMWNEIDEGLRAAFRAHGAVIARAADLEERVARGEVSPHAAARRLLAAFLGDPDSA
ncbi:MAG: methylmalonyl Co-A mutase-associated GTPase MeaB [Alphaproteobacteria bacterium]